MPGFYRENSSLSKKVFFTTSTFQKIRPYFDPFQLFSPLDDRFLLQSGKFTPNKEKNVFSSFFNSGQHCGTWDNMPTKGGGDFGETTQLSNTLILRMTFWQFIPACSKYTSPAHERHCVRCCAEEGRYYYRIKPVPC